MKDQPPKIALLAAFSAGLEIAKFTLDYPFPLQYVATCHRDPSEYETRIAALCAARNVPCKRRIDANEASFVERLNADGIDLVLLAWWPSIIKAPALRAVKLGWINMHPSLLPYNRGKHPYYWSIVENTPFGVSLHFIDEGIDTGRILFQRSIPITVEDTGESLYAKSVEENISLFKESYPRIVALDFSSREQQHKLATSHLANQLDAHSTIELEKEYKAIELLNIIRGRTFLNGESARFYLDGKKYYVRLTIQEAHEETAC